MSARQDGDKRLLQNQLEREVGIRFVAQEGDIDPALFQVLRQRHRESARHPDLDIGQFVAEDACGAREPSRFLSGEKPDGETGLGGSRRTARSLEGSFGLRQ